MSERREAGGGTIWERRMEWINGKAVNVARLSTPAGVWFVVLYLLYELNGKLDNMIVLLHQIREAALK